MIVLVTGATGFIGRNLTLRLTELGNEVLAATRLTTNAELASMVNRADAVVHLAGANRPKDDTEFINTNAVFTDALCQHLRGRPQPVPVIASSTIQVENDNLYGQSKKAGEQHLRAYGDYTGAPVNICRLVNIFGKWCRPNYNSVVATFCHNIARDLPIRMDNPDADVRLAYVDDVIDTWLAWLENPASGTQVTDVQPEYRITLDELAHKLRGYRAIRQTNTVNDIGIGFGRALYSTYVSYIPVEEFTYPVTRNSDERGVFVEMLRTEYSGQFSFFTAGPGVTRGGHYHHTKTEKFLVLRGHARFRFRNMNTGETYSTETFGEDSMVVETVPGWSHDITNIGEDEMICMLWANEIFDHKQPDTIAYRL